MVSLPVIPLARDATGRALPIVLAILVLLGMLLLTAALSVGTFFTTWESSVSGKATIQVMPLDDKALPLAERVADVLHIVRSEAGIKKAEEVSPAAMQGLLAPWLGQEVDLASLPVPALIALEHTNAVNFDQIRKDLSEVAGVSVDDHASWLKTLRQALMMASVGMYGLVGLVLVSIVLIVFLLVRAGMGQHVDVIELLHLTGAEDRFIVRQFMRHMLGLALKGLGLGLCALVLVLMGIGGYSDALGLKPLPLLVAFAAFVLVVLMLVGVTTRLTAKKLLESMF